VAAGPAAGSPDGDESGAACGSIDTAGFEACRGEVARLTSSNSCCSDMNDESAAIRPCACKVEGSFVRSR